MVKTNIGKSLRKELEKTLLYYSRKVIFGDKFIDKNIRYDESKLNAYQDAKNIIFNNRMEFDEKEFCLVKTLEDYVNFCYEMVHASEPPMRENNPSEIRNTSDVVGSIRNTDESLSKDVAETLKKVSLKESDKKWSGHKGKRDRLNEENFKKVLAAHLSKRRANGLSEYYIFSFAKEYTEKYNKFFRTNFKVNYTKPCGKNKGRYDMYLIYKNQL